VTKCPSPINAADNTDILAAGQQLIHGHLPHCCPHPDQHFHRHRRRRHHRHQPSRQSTHGHQLAMLLQTIRQLGRRSDVCTSMLQQQQHLVPLTMNNTLLPPILYCGLGKGRHLVHKNIELEALRQCIPSSRYILLVSRHQSHHLANRFETGTKM